jgi:putative redox protein
MNDKHLKATVYYAGANLYIALSPSGHATTLETDTKRNSAPTPLELLLMALGGCTGSDVISMMRKKRENITSYRVEVRGERREDNPRSFKYIEVRHIVQGHNISEKELVQAIELSETKYCSVAATLRPGAQILFAHEIIKEDSSSVDISRTHRKTGKNKGAKGFKGPRYSLGRDSAKSAREMCR